MAVAYNSDESHGTWSGGSGTLEAFTSGADGNAVNVVMAGYPMTTGDNLAVTIDGNASDDSLQTRDGDGDSAFLATLTDFTAETAQDVNWSGVDSSDDGTYGIYSMTGADVTELQATGWPDSGSDTATNGSVSITVSALTGDLVTDSAEGFDETATANRADVGAGQTEIFEQYIGGSTDVRGAGSYEAAASDGNVTMSYTFDNGEDATYIAAVIPVAAVGGGANPKGVLGGLVFGGPFGGPTG